ncbi:hypothetical protein [Butyrivibrio sp. LC3010]|uniref:hypothetical protein n=1 Tax=Butyrivibrio sp. LC3010 TaxID=1280680 RepID=UPI00040B29DF|nr:hypothetical protein [Butyrivibrio sp. LC3010]
MKRYTLYGLTIESEVEFMQLDEINSAQEGSSEIQIDATIRQRECEYEVIDYLTEHDSLKRKYEIGLEYSCFMNIGGYFVIQNGREIIFQTKEDYTPEKVSPWLLGFSMAMLLLQRRILAIHCSAVTDGDSGAFLISGEMGAGKSSLTRKLIEKGFKIMADDVAAVKMEAVAYDNEENKRLSADYIETWNVLDHAMVFPAFPYQKLCRNEVESRNFSKDEIIYIDENKDKFLVPVKECFVDKPKKLKFMIYLITADIKELKVQRLSGLDQFMALRNNIFLHRLFGEWENDKEIIELCMRVSGKCPVYLILRPKEGYYQEQISDEVIRINNEVRNF